MDQPTKSFNTSGSKNRLRFTSSKARAKRASADVYRTSNSRLFTSATGLREKHVHDDNDIDGRSSKKKKRRKKLKKRDDDGKDNGEEDMEEEEEVRYFGRDNDSEGLGIGRTAVIVSSKSKLQLDEPEVDNVEDEQLKDDEIDTETIIEEEEEEETDTLLLTGGTIFLTEVEISAQRNGSQLFSKLVRSLRPLCKSIAELVHHSERIVELLFAYLLSPRGIGLDDGNNVSDGSSSLGPTPIKRPSENWKSYKKYLTSKEVAPNGYIVNVATNDVLHLIGVLAKELRNELYPYINGIILPRIIDDMLNPPNTTSVTTRKNHNVAPLDVSHVESACRTISYIFKYNADALIHNHPPNAQQQLGSSVEKKDNKTEKLQGLGDADILRQYYGKTICNKRDIVRRLSCEAYAPLLRKCCDKGLKRHLSRTIKALATSLSSATATSSSTATSSGEEESEPGMTNSVKRAKSDAIDGLSTLLFEVSKGSPGRIHSKKGKLVVKTLLDCLIGYASGSSSKRKQKNGDNQSKSSTNNGDEMQDKNKADAVYNVASQFLYKLRGHVAKRTQNEGGEDTAAKAFVDVLDEMHRALDTATSMMKDRSNTKEMTTVSSKVVDCVSGHIIDLMTETINFQDGRLFTSTSNNQKKGGAADRVANSLQALLNHDVYSTASRKLQDQILNYLCSAWRTNPSHPSFALRLGKFFPSIVALSDDSSEAISADTGLDPALFLCQHLLPYLPKKVASKYLIPALLGAAAAASFSQGGKHNDSSLVLLQTIATTVWPTNTNAENANEVDIDDTAVDSLFVCEAAEHCPPLSSKVRGSLFDICLSTDLESTPSKGKKMLNKTSVSPSSDQLARVGYISRCIPFLVCLECSTSDDDGGSEDEDDDSIDNSQLEEVLNRVFKYYASVMKSLDTQIGEHDNEVFIVQSLALESFSKSVMECYKRVSSPKIMSTIKKTLAKAKTVANTLLFHHPTSLWVVKGVAAISKALSAVDPGSRLNDKSNDTFELLVSNLAQANHFLRLYTLQILESYPSRPFVTDHADLDLTDDLEEEPSYKPQPEDEVGGEKMNAGGSQPVSLLSGPCDIISMMKTLESIPVALPNERRLTSQLNRIEVYARTGKLPIVYAEAVACHMLGLLHVKFSPIWPAAVKVIVSLSQAQEGPAWPYIETALKLSMKKPVQCEDDTISSTQDMKESIHTKTITHHYSLCVAWETSKGKKIDIFGPQNQERNAQVSRHVVSDELTLFESVWSIMEDGPNLTSTKSKVVVPIFFEFLVAQYYVFHQDEPDSREINLTDAVER